MNRYVVVICGRDDVRFERSVCADNIYDAVDEAIVMFDELGEIVSLVKVEGERA